MKTETKDAAVVEARAASAHTRSRYDFIAPVYDLLEGPVEVLLYRDWRQTLWQKVEGPRVLELGVGTGKNIPYYPPDVRVTGIDLSEKMLRRARRTAERHPEKNVVLREMDAENLTFPDHAFDETVATFVFCSVPNPVRGLREALRVTRRGGRLLLLEHMRARSPRLARLMQGLDPFMHWLTGVHIARQTVDNVREAGWVIDRITPLTKSQIYRMIEAHKP